MINNPCMTMTIVRKLMSLFTGRLDSFSQVTPDLEPLKPGQMTYSFPIREGVEMEVSFREAHARCEECEGLDRPKPDYHQPEVEAVMDAIQEMYGMIAMNETVLFAEGGRPRCYGLYSKISPSARAENDCVACPSLKQCSEEGDGGE